MNRRFAISTALATLAAWFLRPVPSAPNPKPPYVPLEPRKRPWADRADELWEQEGMWCDYAAWKEWMGAKVDYEDDVPICDMLSGVQSAYLYSAMCDLAEDHFPPRVVQDEVLPF